MRIIFLIVISLFLILIPYYKAVKAPQVTLLAKHEISLQGRYNNTFVNDVFKDNILLTLAYTTGKVTNDNSINWEEVRKPFHFELVLSPQQIFAFHQDVFPEYKSKITYTTNAHFNYQEGFKSDGYLMGDGVCHLASLINWVARDAKLDVVSPTNHNFADIPEIPKEYGTSIYSMPGQKEANAVQNLYIKNNRQRSVSLVFDYKNDRLSLSVMESPPTLSKL